MTFLEIPQLTRTGSYEINVHLGNLINTIDEWVNEPAYGLQLCPDFQRGHVWTEQQQINFMEYFLRGGKSGMVLYFNKPSWNLMGNVGPDGYDDFVLVDGLQRLTAITRFLKDEIPAYGHLCSQLGPVKMSRSNSSLRLNVNDLPTKVDVLKWYLEMNSGGTPHTTEELERVKLLLAKELN